MTEENILDNPTDENQEENILDNQDDGNQEQNELEDKPEVSDDEKQDDETQDKKTDVEPVVPKSRFDQVNKQNKDLEDRLSKYIDQQTGFTPEIENKPKPMVDDFEDHDAYIEALTDWKVDQKYKAHTENQQEYQRKLHKSNIESSVEIKVQEALKFDPEFTTKAYIPAEIVDLVYDSDKFSELGYFFAENRDFAVKLCRAPKHIAAREIGRIEAQLGNINTPKPKVKSNAPRASNSMDGQATKVTKDPDKMNDKEFDQWYNENFNPYTKKG